MYRVDCSLLPLEVYHTIKCVNNKESGTFIQLSLSQSKSVILILIVLNCNSGVSIEHFLKLFVSLSNTNGYNQPDMLDSISCDVGSLLKVHELCAKDDVDT